MENPIADGVKKVTEGVKNMTTSNKPQKQSKKKEKKGGQDGAKRTADELSPEPDFIDYRLHIFDKLRAKYDAEVAKKPREPITITFPDGKTTIGKSWETSPGEIARSLSKSLYERTVISEVDGDLWDLERPLEKSCRLRFLDFDDPKGKQVFWHSSAHVLGECSELCLGSHLVLGPPIDDGFYYEMSLPEEAAVVQSDIEPLERVAAKMIKEKQTFVRLTLSKEDLLEMFKYNKYKQHLINDKIPDGTSTTVYKNGKLIDLCRGPHIPHTGRIKAFKVMKASASYFLGDQSNDTLQRIYGVSFPDKKLMDEHLKYLEEAAKRDHRKIGLDQELFFFNQLSPGSGFFLPHGMIIYNKLQAYIREEYWKRGYQEVQTPNMFNSALWKTSGHWDHYSEDMFILDVEKEKWALKPMNCPGHCLVFKYRERSYRELPIRMAEFGILHRNEASGALSGLTRVRRFVQDDTHIFCTEEQVGEEMRDLFDFLRNVYGKFGLTFKLKLSTRPDKFLGDIKTWDLAEKQLQESLNKFASEGGAQWELNPGDGAFYGPKIDISIGDALNRYFQCATIQLDFQLPQRFELEYMTSEKAAKAPEAPPQASSDDHKPPSPGFARPVMIHRAIAGSMERFLAILIEHLAGKWPFWLSPRQILVVPVMPSVNDYVHEVQAIFREKGMHCDIDVSGNTMQKKIRTGQLSQYNFIFVVGAQEKESRTVNIRNRDDQATQAKGELVPLDVAIEKLVKLRDSKALINAM